VSVLVDTSVWSLALRRRRRDPASAGDSEHENELRELIQADQVAVIGAIRQELLSEIRGEEQFSELRERLSAFHDLQLAAADYEFAAECFNRCRARGIQGSNTDFLICAVAMRRELTIYSLDQDFEAFRRVLPIALHPARGRHT